MIIDLGRKIFVIHPDFRFSKQRHVPEGTLTDLYHRYKKLEYTTGDLKELFYIRTHQHIDRKNLWCWLKSIEIYNRAQMAIKVGAKEVNINFFGNNRELVVKILEKNIKNKEEAVIIEEVFNKPVTSPLSTEFPVETT